jgi:hypothetical protein
MALQRTPLLEAQTTKDVIHVFRDVHRAFGFGYREYIYKRAMELDLRRLGHRVDREVPVTIYNRGEPLAEEKMDMVCRQPSDRRGQSNGEATGDRFNTTVQLSLRVGLGGRTPVALWP